MALFNYKKISNAYNNIIGSEEWLKACEFYKSSKIILFYGHGGNLGIADHAAIDVTRITKSEKIGLSLGSSVQTTSLANDNGYDKVFSAWLEFTIKSINYKKEDICCIGITSTGKSENFKNALNYIQENNLKSIYFTANKLSKNEKYHAELYTDLETYHEAETMALGLTYDLISAAGYKCPSIKK
tara:strand:+ start:4230 stop:4784 length:555 start_codon:yes stop_codon:yes gene_type:complete